MTHVCSATRPYRRRLTCFPLRSAQCSCIHGWIAHRVQVRFTETAERVRRERLLPRSLPPLVGKRVHFQPGAKRDSAELASLRRLVAALGAKASPHSRLPLSVRV